MRDNPVILSESASEWGHLLYYPGWLDNHTAFLYFEWLKQNVKWKQDTLRLFGKTFSIPRLHAFYGDEPSLKYTYSGITLVPFPWCSVLLELREKAYQTTRIRFNTALLNLYRNGSDSNGWHCDAEPELGKNPVLFSVSLGADRKIQFKSKETGNIITVLLKNGDALLMGENTQLKCLHAVPKMKAVTEPRINITFRNIVL